MIARIRELLRAALDATAVESEMQKEMRLHIEMETEQNVRRGMSPAEARRAALIAFGGVEKAKEGTRDERSTRWLEQVFDDVRFAWRGMRKQPAFTLAVVTLLALGTGANTAIFSVVNKMILRPLPFADGGRMIEFTATVGGGQIQVPAPTTLIRFWQSRSTTVEEVMLTRYYFAAYGDTTRRPVRELTGSFITPGMMQFTGKRPVLGRDILPSDTVAGAPLVAIIGSALWKKEFGGDKNVLGRTILLAGQPHAIIGVAEPGFYVPFSSGGEDVFVAMQPDDKQVGSDAIAKLRRGVTIEEARRELDALAKSAPPALGLERDPPTLSDASSITNKGMRRVVLLLFGAVGVVLLIACANVANLLLARAWSRQREFAVRGAMGAGRGRLARQLITESVAFAVVGGLAGFVVAMGLVGILERIRPENIHVAGRIDLPVLAWTLAVSLVTGLLFGVAPVLFIGDGRLGELLKSSARSATGSPAARRLRSALVVVEVALSMVLLIGAGMLVRTLSAMQRADLGMQPDHLAGIPVRFAGPEFKDSTARRNAFKNILARVRSTPGIEAATVTLSLPPDFAAGFAPIEIEGRPFVPSDSMKAIAFNFGKPDMFRVAGLRFLQGRPFLDDARLRGEAGATEVVINERFARRFWPDGKALGARIKRMDTWATVVGVVANLDVPGTKGLPSGVQLYQSMSDAPVRFVVLVKSRLPGPQLEPLLRDAIREASPRATIGRYADADAQVQHGRIVHRFILSLIGGFSILALVLAAIGLHAVISYSVTQRLREIGIRMALGARTGQVANLVLRQGVSLTSAGIVVGAIGGWAAARAMRSLLYGVEPGDPLTMAVVALALVATAVMASMLPARRATRVDPVEMIRVE